MDTNEVQSLTVCSISVFFVLSPWCQCFCCIHGYEQSQLSCFSHGALSLAFWVGGVLGAYNTKMLHWTQGLQAWRCTKAIIFQSPTVFVSQILVDVTPVISIFLMTDTDTLRPSASIKESKLLNKCLLLFVMSSNNSAHWKCCVIK